MSVETVVVVAFDLVFQTLTVDLNLNRCTARNWCNFRTQRVPLRDPDR